MPSDIAVVEAGEEVAGILGFLGSTKVNFCRDVVRFAAQRDLQQPTSRKIAVWV